MTSASDIWSFGLLLFEWWTDEPYGNIDLNNDNKNLTISEINEKYDELLREFYKILLDG